MGPALALLVSVLGGAEAPAGGDEAAVELRALSGYLGLYGVSLGLTSPPRDPRVREMSLDLRGRLEKFLDRPDLAVPARTEAIRLYRGLARAAARAGNEAEAKGAPAAERWASRDLYTDLIRRAEKAGLDTVPIELEMLASAEVGLDAQETYRGIEKMMPRLQSRTGTLTPEDVEILRRILRRLLMEPAWPELNGGKALAGTIELLLGLKHPEGQSLDGPQVAAKLAEWTARHIRDEAAREGELARGTALIHLYRVLEISSGDLDSAQRTLALEGLLSLHKPGLADLPGACEEKLRAVEIGQVRLPAEGGLAIPPLTSGLSPAGEPGYFLVPRKSYRVELICTPEGSGRQQVFSVLARPGPDSRIVLPRCLPPGMVPITAAETGRVAFLADRKPWSMRRFLLALQRCENALSSDQAALARMHKSTALREVPLPSGAEPSFSALVGLLSASEAKERLEEVFWVDGGDAAGQAVAFEIAGTVLSGNTGLRDTALALPTVSEANRLWRDGRTFALDEPHHGLFNATRLVPEPKELGDRRRYVIRAVLPLPSS